MPGVRSGCGPVLGSAKRVMCALIGQACVIPATSWQARANESGAEAPAGCPAGQLRLRPLRRQPKTGTSARLHSSLSLRARYGQPACHSLTRVDDPLLPMPALT